MTHDTEREEGLEEPRREVTGCTVVHANMDDIVRLMDSGGIVTIRDVRIELDDKGWHISPLLAESR